MFRNDFWPNGVLADKAPERDATVRNVTQVLCKAKLLGIVSGENRIKAKDFRNKRGELFCYRMIRGFR